MAVTLFFSNKISINFWGMRDIITFCSFIDYGDHIDKINMRKNSSQTNQIETAHVNSYTLSLLISSVYTAFYCIRLIGFSLCFVRIILMELSHLKHPVSTMPHLSKFYY